MSNHIFSRIVLPFWQVDFTKAGLSDAVEENTLLGVGLRFRKVFYQDRQHLQDMFSMWGERPSRCFLFLYVLAEMLILA